MRLETQPRSPENSSLHPRKPDNEHRLNGNLPDNPLPREAQLHTFDYLNALDGDAAWDPFLYRFEQVQPRIDRVIRNRWRDGLDPFETDNLIQAGYVHLWEGYQRDPTKFNERGDGYWIAVAKRGALYECTREFQEHNRQKGSGARNNRRYVEVVFNAADLLGSQMSRQVDSDYDAEEYDETLLSQDTIYSNETPAFIEADTSIEISRLIQQIYDGTSLRDHLLITNILAWMADGVTWSEMARRAKVKLATIKGTVQRIRLVCGAIQTAKDNKRHHYGSSKDEHIQRLLARGVKPPEIARLIGTDHSYVYRRLRALDLVS